MIGTYKIKAGSKPLTTVSCRLTTQNPNRYWEKGGL